jgi:N utilization substance protein B
MASNRHLGRIIALQTLYEAEFRLEAIDIAFDLDEVLARNISRYEDMVDDVEFIKKLVAGVQHNAAVLDAKLQPVAPEWPIDQIARMDRLVLRIGLYELENEADVPPKVVINEAVELAKAFGGDNSSKFVNGVLGTLLRQRDPVLEPSTDSDTSVKASSAKAVEPTKPVAKSTKKVTTKATKETA